MSLDLSSVYFQYNPTVVSQCEFDCWTPNNEPSNPAYMRNLGFQVHMSSADLVGKSVSVSIHHGVPYFNDTGKAYWVNYSAPQTFPALDSYGFSRVYFTVKQVAYVPSNGNDETLLTDNTLYVYVDGQQLSSSLWQRFYEHHCSYTIKPGSL